MKRGDRTDIEWALDRLVSTAMKWHHYCETRADGYAAITLRSLRAACRRLDRAKRKIRRTSNR